MALAPISISCAKCGTDFTALPKRSFLGFQKLSCPNCDEQLTYPLTSGYRITYWILFGLMVLGSIDIALQGKFPIIGFFGFAIMIALFNDVCIRKQLAKSFRGKAPDDSAKDVAQPKVLEVTDVEKRSSEPLTQVEYIERISTKKVLDQSRLRKVVLIWSVGLSVLSLGFAGYNLHKSIKADKDWETERIKVNRLYEEKRKITDKYIYEYGVTSQKELDEATYVQDMLINNTVELAKIYWNKFKKHTFYFWLSLALTTIPWLAIIFFRFIRWQYRYLYPEKKG